MKIQKFDGGLNTRQEPYLIGLNEGQEYTNIDNEAGSLKPVNLPLAANQTYTDKNRYVTFSKTIQQLAKVPIDFVEYKNKVYYSVEDDYIQMKDTLTEGVRRFIFSININF